MIRSKLSRPGRSSAGTAAKYNQAERTEDSLGWGERTTTKKDHTASIPPPPTFTSKSMHSTSKIAHCLHDTDILLPIDPLEGELAICILTKQAAGILNPLATNLRPTYLSCGANELHSSLGGLTDIAQSYSMHGHWWPLSCASAKHI